MQLKQLGTRHRQPDPHSNLLSNKVLLLTRHHITITMHITTIILIPWVP